MLREMGTSVRVDTICTYMDTYTKEEQLNIYARIGITEEAYILLREEKKRRKISLAKITSELIIKQLTKDK